MDAKRKGRNFNWRDSKRVESFFELGVRKSHMKIVFSIFLPYFMKVEIQTYQNFQWRLDPTNQTNSFVFHMKPHQVVLFVVVVTLSLFITRTYGLASCPITCDPNDPNLPVLWMNTSTMITKAHGLRITSYPRTPEGTPFLNAFGMFELTSIQELQSDSNGNCENSNLYMDPIVSMNSIYFLQQLNFSESCCQILTGWEMIENTTSNRTYTLLNVTNPSRPEFLFLFKLSTVNESASIHHNGSIGTYNQSYENLFEYVSQLLAYSFGIGSLLKILHSPHALKVSIQMQNWPWMGNNLPYPGASFMKYFFNGSSASVIFIFSFCTFLTST